MLSRLSTRSGKVRMLSTMLIVRCAITRYSSAARTMATITSRISGDRVAVASPSHNELEKLAATKKPTSNTAPIIISR